MSVLCYTFNAFSSDYSVPFCIFDHFHLGFVEGYLCVTFFDILSSLLGHLKCFGCELSFKNKINKIR